MEATFVDAEITPEDACEGLTVIKRTWSLVDDCGNAAEDQEQIITIEDNTVPTFTAPADITVYKDENCDYVITVDITGDVTNEADNCTTELEATFVDAEITPEDACEGLTVIKRTWSLVDDCGNAAADQVQTITVEDNTPPTFTRPEDITIYRDATCGYDASVTVTGDVTDEADNCGVGQATFADVVDDDDPCAVVITRTWSLVDNCGNAAADQVQTITVEDNT
ncbi:MAG TPA: hypothetical protein PLV51_06615, partial [Lentimicrobium sp.]|nr:hypothetical protein [Lentimicrobium sp.]